jgi:hypothetical protein
MILTLFSLVLAILIAAYNQIYSISLDFAWVSQWMIVSSFMIFAVMSFLNILSLIPLQKLEQQLIPHLIRFVREEKRYQLSNFFVFIFPILSFALVFISWNMFPLYQIVICALWLIFLGIALDSCRFYIRQIMHWLDPFYVIDKVTRYANQSIYKGSDSNLWQTIDALAEISLKAIEKSQLATSLKALNAFSPIMQNFYISAKSIAHPNVDQQVEKQTGQDEASYTLFYLLQRLQTIQGKALHHDLEMICQQIITILGKIIIYSAKFDVSLVSFPVHFLTKFTLQAQQKHFDEVAQLAISTLLEIARTLVVDIDVRYAELQDPFKAIINGLDAITKEMFRQDKTMNISLLTQPFLDLKQLFATEKMINHQDTPVLVGAIDRILAEYTALEQVMRTIPPFSSEA